MGQAPPGTETNFDGKGTPFVKAGEFGERRPIIREWTTKPLKLAKSSDVFVCVVGATCGKLNLGEDCAIGRSVAAIRLINIKGDRRGRLPHGREVGVRVKVTNSNKVTKGNRQ